MRTFLAILTWRQLAYSEFFPSGTLH
jgi:hypothetical protein